MLCIGSLRFLFVRFLSPFDLDIWLSILHPAPVLLWTSYHRLWRTVPHPRRLRTRRCVHHDHSVNFQVFRTPLFIVYDATRPVAGSTTLEYVFSPFPP